jgi:opacity protein-like surface antigen
MKTETFLPKAGNICLLSFVVMMSCSTLFALDPMGPPAAVLRQGQHKEVIEYSRSTMNIKLLEGDWIEYFDGVFNDSGQATPFTLKDFEMDQAYFNFGYGFTDNLEAFLRLGATTAEFGDSIWQDTEEFYGDADFTIGGGFKATFYDDDKLKIGGLFQASWAKFDGELNASHWSAPDIVEISMAQVQIAVGPTYELNDHVSIYGGPFWHFIIGDLDVEVNEAVGGGVLNSNFSWDIDDSSTFGAFIGTQIDINENTYFNIEYQHTADSDALVAGFLWRF